VWRTLGSKGIYIIACCGLTLIFSFFMVVSYFNDVLSRTIIGTKLESFLSSFLLGLWCACVAIIQDSRNQLATWNGLYKGNTIRNANLYFSSWASFLVTGYLVASILQHTNVFDISQTVAGTPPKLMKWYIILIASIVVLITSADLKSGACSDDCLDNDNTNCYQPRTCRSNNYAISIGAIIGTLSLVATALSHLNRLELRIELMLSVIALIFYAFGTGFITSEDGPGSLLGNLYFSTWAGFISSFMLVCLSGREYFYDGNIGATAPHSSELDKEEEIETPVDGSMEATAPQPSELYKGKDIETPSVPLDDLQL